MLSARGIRIAPKYVSVFLVLHSDIMERVGAVAFSSILSSFSLSCFAHSASDKLSQGVQTQTTQSKYPDDCQRLFYGLRRAVSYFSPSRLSHVWCCRWVQMERVGKGRGDTGLCSSGGASSIRWIGSGWKWGMGVDASICRCHQVFVYASVHAL